jgi:hypothetical protein
MPSISTHERERERLPTLHPVFSEKGGGLIVCVFMCGVQMWERVFFTQDEANRRFLLGNELLLENMMSVRSHMIYYILYIYRT